MSNLPMSNTETRVELSKLFPSDVIHYSNAITSSVDSMYGDKYEYMQVYLSRLVGSNGEGPYTKEQLKELGNLKILVVGCGSVGGQTLEKLLKHGAGVEDNGLVVVIDPENSGPENTQRQLNTALEGVSGVPKIETAVRHANDESPFARVIGIQASASPENLHTIIPYFDIIIMAADASKPEVNLALLNSGLSYEKPVYGGIDLGATAVNWYIHPNKVDSPLLRGLFHTHDNGSIDYNRPIVASEISHDIQDVIAGEKIHPFGWLVKMLDPIDIPVEILNNLRMNILQELTGIDKNFIIQTSVTAERQAQITLHNIISTLDSTHPDNKFVSLTYSVSNSQIEQLYSLLCNGHRKGAVDTAVYEAINIYYQNREEWIIRNLDADDVNFKGIPGVTTDINKKVAEILLRILDVSIFDLIKGRSPLSDFEI